MRVSLFNFYFRHTVWNFTAQQRNEKKKPNVGFLLKYCQKETKKYKKRYDKQDIELRYAHQYLFVSYLRHCCLNKTVQQTNIKETVYFC